MAILRSSEILAVQPIAHFFENQQRSKLIRAELIEVNPDAYLDGCPEIGHAPQQQPSLGRLRGVEPVQRAMVAPAPILRRIMAEPGIAEFFPAKRPMDQKSQGGLLGPLPADQFGSVVS